MTVKELKAKCKELGIEVDSNAKKAELEKAIAAHEKAQSEATPHVICYTCQTSIPQTEAEKLAGQWVCADQSKCNNPNAQAAAKATAAAKAGKKAKAPKAKVIRYRLLDYEPAEGEKQPPRQVRVILDTLKRLSTDNDDGTVLKSVLVETLETNNNNVTTTSIENPVEAGMEFTHDLRAKQPCLHVLMHYQKRLIEEGRIELIK
jgi:hypothetical protein